MRSIERWHFQWPWRTPNPVFKVTTFFEVEYLKYRAFYGQSFYRTLIGNLYGSIERYHLSDLWPGFQGHDISEVEYQKNKDKDKDI